MRLLLIRHAESQGNFEHRLQGRRDYPLTERGLTQARALAERLAPIPLAVIYASPIGRAFQTAERIADAASLSVIPEPRLQEYDFGDALSGLTWPEIATAHPEIVAGLRNGGSDFPHYPGEEGREAFHQRVSLALSEITMRHNAADAVVVVTHAGPISVYLLQVLGRDYKRPIPFSLDNASITTIEFGHQPATGTPQVTVTGVNDTCHLKQIMSSDRASGTA